MGNFPTSIGKVGKGIGRKQAHKDSEFLPKRGNPQHETVTYEFGSTFYKVSTSCGGSELLYDKMKRLIKEESGKTPVDNGFTNPVFFIDGGISGVTFDHPNFNRMIAEIEAENVGTVIVKDMSRLGRDYLKVGYYTEIFFVERDVRYITINDGVDSAKGDNDFSPSRNLFNDFYAKDTSKKVRAIKKA